MNGLMVAWLVILIWLAGGCFLLWTKRVGLMAIALWVAHSFALGMWTVGVMREAVTNRPEPLDARGIVATVAFAAVAILLAMRRAEESIINAIEKSPAATAESLRAAAKRGSQP